MASLKNKKGDQPIRLNAAAVPKWITEELIDWTLRVWEPRYGRKLTRGEAVEILVNAELLISHLEGTLT